ncbi:MAG: Protein transport protein S9 plasma membrane t-SNARE [Candelina mexicana]|nr:MAG: Protein transport protein S9 plasma membrane t-SNARE [Candelina mexicana]
MKKLGFKSKPKDPNSEDSNRTALFGSRSSKSSSTTTTTTPASSNPYAQPQNAYDPYAQDTNKYAHMGKPYSDGAAGYGAGGEQKRGGYGGLNDDRGYDNKQSGGGYGASAGGYGSNGYGGDRYGTQTGGYGADRYGSGAATAAASTRGPAGYGGLGRSNSQEASTATDDNRTALFGGAKDRLAQKSNLPPSSSSNDAAGTANYSGAQSGVSSGGGGGGGASQGYGAYEDRQLTAEEEEEEDVQATKQQIRFMKQEDVSSTRNALRVAAQAEETGRDTLTRLGAQGERIHNTEKNLDLAGNTNRVAEERARELKTLNKSMFAVHVSNPFTAGSRKQARDDDVINKHRAEREQREATRQAAFDSKSRMEGHARNTAATGDPGYGKPPAGGKGKASLAERAKYQFEADSEDDEMENEIDGNLEALSGAAGRLNALARATGREVDEQNTHIERIATKD